jgi:hypothetical protein
VHHDATKPDVKFIDEFTVVVIGSDETATSNCDFSAVTLAGDQTADVVYNIDHYPERDNVMVDTYFSGFEMIEDDCKKDLVYSLDT